MASLLTSLEIAIVSNKFLGALAVKLGFHRHLQHFSSPIQASITHYAEIIQMAEAKNDGAMDYWIGTKDPPKVWPRERCDPSVLFRGIDILVKVPS